MKRLLAPTLMMALPLWACSGDVSGGGGTVCEQAASHFERCTGRKVDVPVSCDEVRAQAVMDTECSGRSAQAFIDDLCALLAQYGMNCMNGGLGNLGGAGNVGGVGNLGGFGPGTCAGQCGSPNNLGGCYCNAECLQFGDCCPDFTFACGGAAGVGTVGNVGVLGAGSCAGQCGNGMGAWGCFCDPACAQFGDCCADFNTACGGAAGVGNVGGVAGAGNAGNAVAGTCTGKCGSTTGTGGCFCDAQCAQFGDCCADYNTACPGAAGAGNAGAAGNGSCAGKCGSTTDAGGCFCDTQCAQFSDCCADYKTACP